MGSADDVRAGMNCFLGRLVLPVIQTVEGFPLRSSGLQACMHLGSPHQVCTSGREVEEVETVAVELREQPRVGNEGSGAVADAAEVATRGVNGMGSEVHLCTVRNEPASTRVCAVTVVVPWWAF